MLKIILVGLVVIVGVFLIVVAIQPSEFRITRSATFAAPSATLFPYVNDLHKWNEWSPWAKLDPNVKQTFEGPTTGVGASFAWSGNNDVGEGKMTIIESRPDELVKMRLEFIKPFVGTNITEIGILPQGEQTSVTWSMSGQNNFLFKAMGLFMNCDKMVGDQFEQGFANLKPLVETQSAK